VPRFNWLLHLHCATIDMLKTSLRSLVPWLCCTPESQISTPQIPQFNPKIPKFNPRIPHFQSEVFGSLKCDCREQLHHSLKYIAKHRFVL
jgi:hypothetical protein